MTARDALAPVEPIGAFEVPVAGKQVESTLYCGFRVPWVDGTINGEAFALLVGAGVGSPWMIFTYRGKECIVNVSDVVRALIGVVDRALDE
jgi:hypothetical protein